MTLGPFWRVVALLPSLAACSISGWEIKGILTQCWETLLSDPDPSTYNVDHSNMRIFVGGAQGPPSAFLFIIIHHHQGRGFNL